MTLFAWLVPLAVVVIFVAASFFGRNYKVRRTPEEVASYIEDFANGRGGRWDWDDFISVVIADPSLDALRERCNGLSEEFPPLERGHFCGPAGIEVLRKMAFDLRAALPNKPLQPTSGGKIEVE